MTTAEACMALLIVVLVLVQAIVHYRFVWLRAQYDAMAKEYKAFLEQSIAERRRELHRKAIVRHLAERAKGGIEN
ncbi:MAG: hypothetical protein AMXMBFR84_37630 [Candidatus Hydrogenedentota bacterium]